MKYTDQHEWIQVEGDIGTIGITEYAAHQLGDVVFADLPPLGSILFKGSQAAVVESVKAASEVYAPVGGEVVEINEVLHLEPSLVNTDPVGAGWFFKVKITDLAEMEGLMDEMTYRSFIGKRH